MNKITTDQAINFTKNLKILYAEDDKALQEQTRDFFEVLFASVSIADDGQEALSMYKKEYFDIVISDVKMPNMDGIELCKKIREINSNQCIIIISAYNDNEYLMEFINLNIKQFIQKPINVDDMLRAIYQTSKNIVNEKMVEEYRADLEHSNQELIKKNEELNSLVRILDSKLLQIGKSANAKKIDIDISLASIDDKDLMELKELEVDINGAAILINLSKNLSVENIQVLGSMFINYSKILKKYNTYNELSSYMLKIGGTLNNAPKNFIKRVNDISILLESFIYVLRMWRNNIVNKDISKALELHSSMINDINTIISIINGTEDKIQSEMEFF